MGTSLWLHDQDDNSKTAAAAAAVTKRIAVERERERPIDRLDRDKDNINTESIGKMLRSTIMGSHSNSNSNSNNKNRTNQRRIHATRKSTCASLVYWMMLMMAYPFNGVEHVHATSNVFAARAATSAAPEATPSTSTLTPPAMRPSRNSSSDSSNVSTRSQSKSKLSSKGEGDSSSPPAYRRHRYSFHDKGQLKMCGKHNHYRDRTMMAESETGNAPFPGSLSADLSSSSWFASHGGGTTTNSPASSSSSSKAKIKTANNSSKKAKSWNYYCLDGISPAPAATPGHRDSNDNNEADHDDDDDRHNDDDLLGPAMSPDQDGQPTPIPSTRTIAAGGGGGGPTAAPQTPSPTISWQYNVSPAPHAPNVPGSAGGGGDGIKTTPRPTVTAQPTTTFVPTRVDALDGEPGPPSSRDGGSGDIIITFGPTTVSQRSQSPAFLGGSQASVGEGRLPPSIGRCSSDQGEYGTMTNQTQVITFAYAVETTGRTSNPIDYAQDQILPPVEVALVDGILSVVFLQSCGDNVALNSVIATTNLTGSSSSSTTLPGDVVGISARPNDVVWTNITCLDLSRANLYTWVNTATNDCVVAVGALTLFWGNNSNNNNSNNDNSARTGNDNDNPVTADENPPSLAQTVLDQSIHERLQQGMDDDAYLYAQPDLVRITYIDLLNMTMVESGSSTNRNVSDESSSSDPNPALIGAMVAVGAGVGLVIVTAALYRRRRQQQRNTNDMDGEFGHEATPLSA